MQSNISSLEQDLANIKDRIKSVTAEKNLLQSSVANLKRQCEDLETTKTKAEANFQAELAQMQTSLSNHLHSLDSNKVQIESLEKRIKDKDKKLKDQEDKINDLED